MAGKKKSPGAIAASVARATVEALEDEREAGEIVIGEDDELEAEQEAMGSLAALSDGEGGVQFVVKCINPAEKAGTLMRVSAAELPDLIWTLRDTYGPGTYSVHASGKRGYIRGSHRLLKVSPLVGNGAKGGAGSPTAAATDAAGVLRELEARNDRMRLEQREDRKFLLQLFAPIATALVGNLISKPPSLAEQAQALATLKSIGGDSGGGEDKALALLMKGAELAEKLGGKGSAGGWPELIRDGLREARETITAMRGSGAPALGSAYTPPPPPAPAKLAPPAAPAALPSPAASPPPAGGAATPPAEGDASMWSYAEPIVRKLAVELFEFAQAGADPGLAAEALYAKVPRQVRSFVTPAQMLEWLQRPDWWSVTLGFYPALEPYQGFCDDVRVALVQIFSGPPQGEAGEDE